MSIGSSSLLESGPVALANIAMLLLTRDTRPFSPIRAHAIVTVDGFMSDRPICKSTDHLFVPILEVSILLLRCIYCNAFAYHDTVKELAKNRRYQPDAEPRSVPPHIPAWRR